MYVLKILKPVHYDMRMMRILYSAVCIVLLTISAVSGFSTDSYISQIQEAGVKINNESLPPQLALHNSIHHSGSGETEDDQNRQGDSEETAEEDVSLEEQSAHNLFFTKQEDYKRDCFKIVPGLQIKDLIFPFHFHT